MHVVEVQMLTQTSEVETAENGCVMIEVATKIVLERFGVRSKRERLGHGPWIIILVLNFG